MILETASTLFRKALDANSQSQAFTIPSMTATPPDETAGATGKYRAGAGGALCSKAIVLLPYGEGNPGASFSFRLFGWREVLPNAETNRITWVPFPMVEVFCTLSQNNGLPNTGGTSDRYIKDSEYTCDFISLTYGSLGLTGILSTAPTPGSGLTSYLVVELFGPRFFSFDFQQVDNVGMNCLWSLI